MSLSTFEIGGLLILIGLVNSAPVAHPEVPEQFSQHKIEQIQVRVEFFQKPWFNYCYFLCIIA